MYIFTEEHRRKLRESHLGKKPGNYGKHYTFAERIKKQCSYCKKEYEATLADKSKYCSPQCFKDSRLTAEEKKEKRKLHDLKWNRSEGHRLACKKWQRNNKDKYNTYQKNYIKKQYPKNRIKAASAIHYYYNAGKIKRQPCVICSTDENVEQHHPDYSQPLYTIWLCKRCHIAIHRNLISINNIPLITNHAFKKN